MESIEDFSARTGLYIVEVPTPFLVGPVNLFLLKRDDEPITLIDAGCLTDESHEALEANLAVHKLTYADIQRIILTHHHIDHTGLVARIKETSDAEVCGHPDLQIEADLANSRAPENKEFYYNIMCEFGVSADMAEEAMSLWSMFRHLHQEYTVDRNFVDGEKTGLFRTHFVPGHSSTDTLLVNEDEGYTIVGDHILERFNPNPLLRRPIDLSDPRPHVLHEYQDSLARSRALDLGLCLPGHGDPIPDHRKVIDGIIEKHDQRNEKILSTITEEGYTPYGVARMLYPELAVPSLYLSLSVATGQLEVLEAQGILKSEIQDKVIRYYKA